MWSIPRINKPNEPYAWASDIFSQEELEKIISIGQSIEKIEGGVDQSETPNHDSRRSKIAWIVPNNESSFIYTRIVDALNQINEQFYGYDIDGIEDLQFSEYDSSYAGMYKSHSDDSLDTTILRKLSFTLQLSTENSYEGGDLLLYRFKLNDPIQVKKQKGILAVFPSSTIHEVTPVTKGVRYSLVGWAYGPNFR
jgi:PKHD-type hydroxylase